MKWIVVFIILAGLAIKNAMEKNGKKIGNWILPDEADESLHSGWKRKSPEPPSISALRNRKEDILKRANMNNVMVNEAVISGNTARREREQNRMQATGVREERMTAPLTMEKKEAEKRPSHGETFPRRPGKADRPGKGMERLKKEMPPVPEKEEKATGEEAATFLGQNKDILGGFIFDGFAASDALYLAKKDVEEGRNRLK